MKFQEAVENLVNDSRAEAIGREIWGMHSIVYRAERLYFNNTNFEYDPRISDILASDWYVKYKDNKSTAQLEVEAAIAKLADSYTECYYASFVGGPGDFSPPRCSCDSCIVAGRSFKYMTGTYKIDPATFEYLWNLLLPLSNTRLIRAGLEYHEHAKCRILLQPTMQVLCVEANKPEIKIGKYVFNIETKTFSK